ncbi:retrovirus-related pol polyprotein from transposon TNT 1-94 [Tanacetum coccineum]|uniref:Retrovirus-related pol polyprotein from transposon TNT 1-94 n=1 Tax=Tanacetum coccineum TaxID=301880 RepID=A0ABQ4YWZ1_9ASTR
MKAPSDSIFRAPSIPARFIRTDNGTEFVNQTLKAYYEEVRISHQTSAARTPQQNVVTTCCTQNRSLIRKRHNKTSYELLHDLKRDLPYLHVVGALCYPTNDSEDLGKLKPKANIRIFIGYAPTKKAFRIYNKRTHLIIETIHVDFDEMTRAKHSFFNSAVIAPEPAISTNTPSSTTINQDAPSLSTSQTTQETPPPVIPLSVEEANHDLEVSHMDNNPNIDFPFLEPSSEESFTQVVIPNNVHSINQPPEHIKKWTKDHPIDNVIGDPSRPVSTRHQLYDEAYFAILMLSFLPLNPRVIKKH